MKKCKILNVFLQNYGYENKEVQTFLIKNNKHYLF